MEIIVTIYPLVICYIAIENAQSIEIVDLPMNSNSTLW